MTRIRIWFTIAASCVAITTVVPLRLIRSSKRMIPSDVSGSKLPVGSSARSNSGRFTIARAIATRCSSPPESSWGRRFSLPAKPTSSKTSGTWVSIAWRGLPITSIARATFSYTVFEGSKRKSWNTVPTWRRSLGTDQRESLPTSWPRTHTFPDVARISLMVS